MADLEIIPIGLVIDMLIERSNDDYEYPEMGTQEDLDRL